jgi:predicted NBD/HSP70 family sugar kinase
MENNRQQQMQLKNLNRISVLNYIRRNKFTTKTALADDSGLTFMAIQKIREELTALGLVRQDAYQDGHVGRRAITYTIDENYGYTVGLHVNIYKTRAAVMNLHGEILALKEVDMGETDEDPAVLVDMFASMVESVMETSGLDRHRILGLGIGAPGPINKPEGRILSPPNFTAIRHMPLRQILHERLAMTVLLHRDTNAVAMGEYWHGAGTGYSNMVYIDADMGIGSGLIIDGRLHEGANYYAGQFGHITLDPNGPVCNCGGKGCLDAMASGVSVVREFQRRLLEKSDHPLARRGGMTILDVLQAGAANDMTAVSIINEAAHNVGLALGTLINIFDPELIVVGGILVSRYAPFFEIVKETTMLRNFSGMRENIILPTSMADRAGVIGAGELVADHFFRTLINDVLAKNNTDTE